ncbi:MAG: phosphoribosyltransferase family protein [Gemmatimonadota bacterium]
MPTFPRQKFRDRVHAGRLLADELAREPDLENAIVLGLPRGGVPIAAEVALLLGLPLDVLNVRKLPHPWQPELAIGAIASGGAVVLNPEVVQTLDRPESTIEEAIATQRVELDRREKLYRGKRPMPSLAGRTVILVDDGVATGATVLSAIEAVRQHLAKQVLVAVPVAPLEVYAKLEEKADHCVCLLRPDQFTAVSVWYDDFSEVQDAQVRRLLDQSAKRFHEHSA